ncbi:MAG: hypothetical protein P9L91_03320, partial [Candidatus Zophobacter franzmannii]|nr:hypothetical protein [Candidatus Zophobacter franzmannii]
TTETFDVSITIGAGFGDTQQVMELASGMTEQVTFASFTPVVNNTYDVTVMTVLGTDVNAVNDQLDSALICLDLDVQVYADVAYDATALLSGPVTFSLQTPGTITDLTELNPWAGGYLAGADWMANGWHGVDSAFNIWEIDPVTGAGTVGALTGEFNGVAYDEVNDIWYGATSTELYTFDIVTGTSTLIGTYGAGWAGLMIGIAYDSVIDVLYGVDLVTDVLYTIDTTTGAATEVGALGIDRNYAQDMAIDRATGNIYLAGYTSTGSLYWINSEFGSAWKIGDFQGGYEMTGFAIPFASITSLDPPVVALSDAGELSWGAVPEATTYQIWAAEEPNGTFQMVNVTTNLTWTDINFGDPRWFYYVVATTDAVRSANRVANRVDMTDNGNVFRTLQRASIANPATADKFERRHK